jgi:hypothetical protein
MDILYFQIYIIHFYYDPRTESSLAEWNYKFLRIISVVVTYEMNNVIMGYVFIAW